jgi:isobutyryl-CoA mutase
MQERPLRILTAVAAYDGHDASVLALNRALLAGGKPVEVVYLGFNMTGEQITAAALQEGVDAVAVSSYNGGHLQFFPHLVRRLQEEGMDRTLVFGGGGGTILAEDAAFLESSGVAKIYRPGWPLDAIAADITERIETAIAQAPAPSDEVGWTAGIPTPAGLSRLLTIAEHTAGALPINFQTWLTGADGSPARVVAIAGDGGSGKSTLIDELVQHFLSTFPSKKIAILANDPTTATSRVATAFLADRVRMNHIYDERVWLRSVATGSVYAPVSPALPHMLRVFRAAGFDLVLVETPGTGQTGLDLRALNADLLVYVKTREYGGSLQLHKDQLLRDAGLVVLNKADLEGAEAAFGEMRAVLAELGKGEVLFPTTAKATRDPGLANLFTAICLQLGWPAPPAPKVTDIFHYAKHSVLVPHRRRAYLAEIADKVRAYDRWTGEQLHKVRTNGVDLSHLDPACAKLLQQWPGQWQELSLQACSRTGIAPLVETPNGLKLPRVALPDPDDRAESLRFLLEEGLPGSFPYATGIYPYRPASAGETTRQFAGLRGPEETNRRLHLLARGVARPRISIAFDGITLYGADSDEDPGSMGKIGEGGVAIDTWEDMKLVLEGFHIPDISTSMTINGPAPIILAMYFVAAQDIELERAEREKGTPLSEVDAKRYSSDPANPAGDRAGRHPEGGAGTERKHLPARVRHQAAR